MLEVLGREPPSFLDLNGLDTSISVEFSAFLLSITGLNYFVGCLDGLAGPNPLCSRICLVGKSNFFIKLLSYISPRLASNQLSSLSVSDVSTLTSTYFFLELISLFTFNLEGGVEFIPLKFVGKA